MNELIERAPEDQRPTNDAGFAEEPYIDNEEDQAPKQLLIRYRHCGITWTQIWTCACNDRCPNCRHEIEPYDDEELDSYRRFAVPPDSGAVEEQAPSFSTQVAEDCGHGRLARVTDDEIVSEAFRILAKRFSRFSVLNSPTAAREYLALRYAGLEHEVFTCIFLDAKNRVIACEELFRGTLTAASVHPREVAKRALALNAASLILAHNHPSGVADPSEADQLITQRLKDMLALLEIRVLDHLVVGGEQVISLVEHGLL